MNETDLEKIGNANLHLASNSLSYMNKPSEISPSKFQLYPSPQKYLKEQSHLDNPSQLQCNQCLSYHFDSHAKCTKITKTKWDAFAPYMFNKLTKEQKDQTFLKLYDDYRGIKGTLNKQYYHNKRLTTKLHLLQQQLAKLKSGQNNLKKHTSSPNKQKQQTSLKQQIKRLHEKILALTNNKPKNKTRPQTANKNQKLIIPANENIRAQLQSQRKHIRELLLVIDQLKKNKFQVQQQLKTKQANQPKISKSTLSTSQKKYLQNNSQLQFKQYSQDLHQWKQKYTDLELVYHRMNQDKDHKIKSLSAQLITIKQNQKMKTRLMHTGTLMDYSQRQKYQDKIKQLSDDKQKLEIQLRRLVQTPFYQNTNKNMNSQDKMVNLQIKYEKAVADLAIASDTNSKYLAQLQFKTRENTLLKSQNQRTKKQLKQTFDQQLAKALSTQLADLDYDDYYRKKLALVKLQGNDPVWKKFQAIAKPDIHLMSLQQLRPLTQKLWLNKLQLLSHIQKAQIQLKTLKQSSQSQFYIYIRDKQLLESQLKQTKQKFDQWKNIDYKPKKNYNIYQQNNIKYDDTISVFDADQQQLKQLTSKENYFDLYLGNMNINQQQLGKNKDNKIKTSSHFVSVFTVDFYIHQTQTTNCTQGLSKKIGENFSFKVQIDTCFIKYITKNPITLSLWSPQTWSSQQNANVLLGKGQIYLSDLLTKTSPDISTVIRGKCQIYNDRSPIASIQYRFRMRLPLSPFTPTIKQNISLPDKQFKLTSSKNISLTDKQRILEIAIDGAQGLPPNIITFVFFQIQQQKYYTEPIKGSSPTWNYKQQIKILVDQQFIQQMKHNYFKFTIFDDSLQTTTQDIFGIAKANFTPLVQDKNYLDLLLDIEDDTGKKKGKLKVRTRWTY